MKLKFRLEAHKNTGLRAAPRILERELQGGLTAVGKTLVRASRARMRRDTEETQKSVRYEVKSGKGRFTVEVFSTLIQAFIDAYGLHRGVFAPWDRGSRIYGWATRHIHNDLVPSKGQTPQGPVRPKTRREFRTARRVTKVTSVGQPKGTSRRYRQQQAQIKRFSFLIARAIYRRGIKGSGWNVKALQANQKYIVNQLQNALSRAANAINRT